MSLWLYHFLITNIFSIMFLYWSSHTHQLSLCRMGVEYVVQIPFAYVLVSHLTSQLKQKQKRILLMYICTFNLVQKILRHDCTNSKLLLSISFSGSIFLQYQKKTKKRREEKWVTKPWQITKKLWIIYNWYREIFHLNQHYVKFYNTF